VAVFNENDVSAERFKNESNLKQEARCEVERAKK
jgi:hypothetical protein